LFSYRGGLWALIDIHKKTSYFYEVLVVDYSDQIIESLVDEMEKFSALFESLKKPQELS
jgi:hypothetical protein